MSTPTDSRPIISAFLEARADSADQKAVELMTPTFTFESPLMRFEDRATYLASHRAFQRFLLDTRMISELYGPGEATLIYDLVTSAGVEVQRTAEHFRIEGGKVASILLLFDSAPWRPIFEAIDPKSR